MIVDYSKNSLLLCVNGTTELHFKVYSLCGSGTAELQVKVGPHRTRAYSVARAYSNQSKYEKNVHISFSVWGYRIKFIITAIQRSHREEDASLKRRNLRII